MRFTFVQDFYERTSMASVRTTIHLPCSRSLEWSIFAHQPPNEPRIYYFGRRNTTCYALRISWQLSKPFEAMVNGPNAIDISLSISKLLHGSIPEPMRSILSAMPAYFKAIFDLLQTNSPQPTVISEFRSIHRICLLFQGRTRRWRILAQEAFADHADAIMDRPRITILLRKWLVSRANSKPPNAFSPTHQHLRPLYSAFDAPQKVCRLRSRGHDPHGRPLILGSGSKRHLVEKCCAGSNPETKLLALSLEHTGNQHLLYLPKIIRNASAPCDRPSSQKTEYYHILGPSFSPAKSS